MRKSIYFLALVAVVFIAGCVGPPEEEPIQAVPLFCGDGILQAPNDQGINEECDGTSDLACPGKCISPGDENECTCSSEFNLELCMEKCSAKITSIENLDKYVDYACSTEAVCTVGLKTELITKKVYSDFIDLDNFRLVLRTEVDTPFLKTGEISLLFRLENFNPLTEANLTIRNIAALENNQLLAETTPQGVLNNFDSNITSKLTLTYDTKEFAELRYITLRILYSYDSISTSIGYNEDGSENVTTTITPIRSSTSYPHPPLIVLNKEYVSEDLVFVV